MAACILRNAPAVQNFSIRSKTLNVELLISFGLSKQKPFRKSVYSLSSHLKEMFETFYN